MKKITGNNIKKILLSGSLDTSLDFIDDPDRIALFPMFHQN